MIKNIVFVMSWACSPEFSSQGKSLADYCDKLYLSYQLGCTKPDKGIFYHMLEDSGMVPSETLFVDDGDSNVRIGLRMVLTGGKNCPGYYPVCKVTVSCVGK